MDRSLEMQKALNLRLTTDAPLMAIITGVYDAVPQKTTFPYVVIGETIADEDGTQTYNGMDGTLTIHSWSEYSGRFEIKEIQRAVYNALHRKPLALDAGTNWELIFDTEDSFLDNDGETRHGIQQFKYFTVR